MMELQQIKTACKWLNSVKKRKLTLGLFNYRGRAEMCICISSAKLQTQNSHHLSALIYVTLSHASTVFVPLLSCWAGKIYFRFHIFPEHSINTLTDKTNIFLKKNFWRWINVRVQVKVIFYDRKWPATFISQVQTGAMRSYRNPTDFA